MLAARSRWAPCECGAAFPEPFGEARLPEDARAGLGDIVGRTAGEEERLDAVAHLERDIRGRKDDGASGRQEFGKLRGQAVIVEMARAGPAARGRRPRREVPGAGPSQ